MKNQNGEWETFDDYVLDFALDQVRSGLRVGIVTLVEVDGSSPWPPGAQMAVAESGKWVGYLSGGCIERAVAAEVAQAFERGRSRCIRYGRGSPFLDIQLPCGSAIELVVDVNVSIDVLEDIDATLRGRRNAVLRVPDPNGLIKCGTEKPLYRLYLPRKRLMIAGIGPVAVQLARLARTAGFDVVLASPDQGTIGAAGLADVQRMRLAPADVEAGIDIDARTAVVLAFHDHEWEEDILPLCLNSNAFYIGAMGSRRTHEERLKRMASKGFDPACLARIHGPAGISGRARGATQIAVSILAEAVEAESREVEESGLLFNEMPKAEPREFIAREHQERASGTSLAECPYGRQAVPARI